MIYRKIYPKMWNSKDFLALSNSVPCGRYLWFYLLTNPDTTNIPGIYRAGLAQMSEVLKWPVEGFLESFAELFRQGLAKADWEARVVWVPMAVYYDEPANPNIVKSWGKLWELIPESPLKDEAHNALGAYCRKRGKAFHGAFVKALGEPLGEPLPEPLEEPLEEPFSPGLPNPDPDPEPEQEPEQEIFGGTIRETPLKDYTQVEVYLSGQGFSISGSNETMRRVVRLLPVDMDAAEKAVAVCADKGILAIGYWAGVVDGERADSCTQRKKSPSSSVADEMEDWVNGRE